jgi:hypothetical protein
MSKFGKNKYIEICGTTRHETEKAWLVELQKNGEEVWIPKSQIEPGTSMPSIDDQGQISVAEWIAKKNGWITGKDGKSDDEIPF